MNRRQTYGFVSDERYKKVLKQGNDTEQKFIKLMEARGNKVRKASEREDKYMHIDVWVNGDGIDVKGNKRIDYLWLELTNAFGFDGWLLGNAKWIAFDMVDLNEFHIYKREDLYDFVIKNVSEYTDSSKDFMKFYTRIKWGSNDKVVRCRLDDIKHLLIQTLDYAITNT